MSTTKSDVHIHSVSELNRQARIVIEDNFQVVWVMGEMSNFARPRSGHWYFSLKDTSAQVRCAMFANRNRAVQMQPGDGQQVLIRGRVSIYEGRGDFQIIADYMEPAGEGALRQAFDQLKIKLTAEGLFEREHKQALPEFPRSCAVITSPGAAALHDVLSIWRRRFPPLEVYLVPSMVQGDAAIPQLMEALERAQALEPDVILLTRGGGSLEDLWCFNAEPLARAIAACTTPVVSAVGHEIDTTIADLVADLRAPTPSAAAELITPDGAELAASFASYERYLCNVAERILNHHQLRLEYLNSRLQDPASQLAALQKRVDDALHQTRAQLRHRLSLSNARLAGAGRQLRNLGPQAHIERQQTKVTQLKQRTSSALTSRLEQLRQRLAQQGRMLHQLSPLPTLERGYALLTDAESSVISSVEDIKTGQQIVAKVADGNIQAAVVSTDKNRLSQDTNT